MATTTEPTQKRTASSGSAPTTMAKSMPANLPPVPGDPDPIETRDWLESLEYVLENSGPDRVGFLLQRLEEKAYRDGVRIPTTATTPYVNTITRDQQPVYPGDRAMERRIKSIVRWNAAAMVVHAQHQSEGIGGHISTYASAATLYEVAFNHFFRGDADGTSGDLIYFQGHASPGIYSRAYFEGRLSAENLHNFRRELAPEGGLSSYPHPWLMPKFWMYPTVSMGLGPIMSIYQARFNRYLQHRGLAETDTSRVWAFLGDGECDEPESLGAIGLAVREKLDNLTWVINCNLQRLDGPVRGNSKIIQELEANFRGAGWNVIKVIWGNDWDALLAEDVDGLLVHRLGEVVDGQMQKYSVSDGKFIRDDLFGVSPELEAIAAKYTDDEIRKLRRGGHDPEKVYAAYKLAVETKGAPTVILAHTIKGYGLGVAGEAQNTAHNKKKMDQAEMIAFRDRFGIPLTDEQAAAAQLYLPPADSPEMKYLHERRKALNGYVPERKVKCGPIPAPRSADYVKKFAAGGGSRPASTTMAFVSLITDLLKDKDFGKLIVPIVPDESRTFGMDPLFAQVGIYAHQGQLYEPVDRKVLMYYKESREGQILEEGINEAGAMSSFIAAGTAHVSHGVNTIPFFVYYSMFGFQRIGDLIWAAADMRCRGFLMGGTAGRTTLNGEGLQHEDGHSHLIASSVPNLRAYDPAWAFETAVIVMDGIKRMYHDQEDVMYYITVHNENYPMPAMPEGAEEGILNGIYPFKKVDAAPGSLSVQLLGSGSILREVLRAQEILASKYNIGSQVFSVTSYKTLARDGEDCERWNLLHPSETPRKSWLEKTLETYSPSSLVVASSDNVRGVPLLAAPFVKSEFYVLGTDGFGRSESRENLRRFFEVDAEHVVLATLYRLALQGKIPMTVPANAVAELRLDPNKPNPVHM